MSIVDTNSNIEETLTSYKDLMEKIRIVSDPFDENSDIKRGNANINGLSVQGKLQQIANESSKIYALKYLVSPRFAKAHQNGDIHIHDLDYYLTKTTTCTQIDLGEMLENGIWNEHGWIRPPKSIQTAAYLAAVVLQSHQNQQHGGQSYPNFDFDLAPYVRLSYEKNYNRIFDEAQKVSSGVIDVNELEKAAWEQTEHDTLQAMEGFVHNINTMHCLRGDTKVKTSNGIKEIKDVKPGDYVFSKNTKTGEIEKTKVKENINNGVRHVYRYKTKSGREIFCTQNHKVLQKRAK